MRPRPLPILLLILAVSWPVAPAVPGPAEAQERRPPTRARFEAPAGGSLLVHGEYPEVRSSCVRPSQPLLHARYRGSIEVGRTSDGSLFIIGETPFEDYLKGIAEVPRSWPMAALKAQVVAARSYALVQLERGDSRGAALGYDLCATDACQVYAGMVVEAGPFGDRWVRAVDETAGEVLVHEGRPAETFYFSTSNGRTYTNQEVWGSDPLPYLPSVREDDDGESPLSHWRVRIPFEDLARFLGAAGRWSGGEIRGAAWQDGAVVLWGDGRARLSKAELRSALNATASCLDPDGYPQEDEDGYRPPQTVPAIWYDVRREGRALVLEGRGWGHGIGMVQWGAKGKADRGMAYGDILAAYYGSLRPQRVGSPGTIRVLIAEGLRSVTVAPSEEAEVRIGDRDRTTRRPLRVEPVRERVQVRPAPAPEPVLRVSGLQVRRAGEGPLTASLTASKPVRARMEFLRDGEVIGAAPWEPQRDERFRLTAPASGDLEELRVRVRATDGVDTLVTEARRVRHGETGGSPPAPTPAPTSAPSPERVTPEPTPEAAPTSDDWGVALPLGLGIAAALGAGLLALTIGRRRRLHRGR
jgi:stage II sporulation protein D